MRVTGSRIVTSRSPMVRGMGRGPSAARTSRGSRGRQLAAGEVAKVQCDGTG